LSPPISKALNTNIEKTKVLHGTAATTKLILKVFSATKESWDVCADYSAPSVTIEVEPFKNAFVNFKSRAVKVRYITEVTKENLHYCKKLRDFITEFRHLDGVKGNFGISDKRIYMAAATMLTAKPVTELIYSNVRGIVEQQQYLFETLWNKSIPAEQKIREIEEGTDLDIIELIRDSKKAKNLYLSLVHNARNEIMLVFPSVNVLGRHEKIGIMQLLFDASNNLNVKVRILMPANNFTANNSQISQLDKKIQGSANNIDIRYIEQISESKSTVLVVDRELSLVMELKDDLKETFEEAVGISIYSNSGAGVLSYVSIFENLWKQAELYQQVKESNELLKLQDKMQKEFINVAAHELRTPIQPILGLSGLLYSRIKKNDEKKNVVVEERTILDQEAYEKKKQLEMLEIIIRNANRLQRLSEDILDVTRIESQTLNLKPEIIDLNELISSIMEDIKDQIKINYDVKLSSEQAKDIIYVQADKARLNQVISNLLNNSIKFTKQGAITVTTTAKNMQDQNKVMVSIKDTGTGIHPEVLSRLFTKFATKSYQGTGLGLYISKSIVEAHGGKMWAENNADTDKGCTFYFTLPVATRESK
jgi:two-component system sensor histidine kinase VicK